MTSADHNQTSEDRSVIDISKIRPGDTVTFRGEVSRVNQCAERVDVGLETIAGFTVWVRAERLVSHTPRQIQVGDRVRVSGGTYIDREGTVKATDNGAVWVCLSGYGYQTVLAGNLERIP